MPTIHLRKLGIQYGDRIKCKITELQARRYRYCAFFHMASMGSTPPRPKRKAPSVSEASISSPTNFGNQKWGKSSKPEKITIIFSMHTNWTRWVKIDLKQGNSGYDKGNDHVDNIRRALSELKNRNLLVLHTPKMWPSDAPNEMYKYFPGYGNRIDLDMETQPAASFVAGVHDHLVNECSDDIQEYKFVMIPDGFGTLQHFASADKYVEAIKALPPVPPPDDEEDVKIDASYRELVDEQLADLKRRVAALEDKLNNEKKS